MYYKVVRNVEGRLLSAILHNDGEVTITYKLGEWVVPNIKDSLIFVFDSYDCATQFIAKEITSVIGLELWECEVADVQKLENMANPSGPSVIRYWRNPKEYSYPKSPVGTVGTTAVKLLRRV